MSPHRRERNHGCTAFRVGYRRGSSSVEPPCRFWCSSPPTSAWVVNAEYPPAHPGSGPWWESPWGWGQGRRLAPRRRRNLVTPSPQGPGAVPGHDELPEPTGRALTDCPPTWIKTVFQGDGRLTADRPIVPETNIRLLNWTVSSRVSIPNVRAYGVSPSPHEARPTKLPSPGRGQVRGDARVWRRDSRVARTDENRSVIASIECIENRCPVEHFALF